MDLVICIIDKLLGGLTSLIKKNMKNKFLSLVSILLFVLIFFFFYKGLKNSNIYTPVTKIEKDIPFFEAKIFDKNENISSNEIFIDDNKFYL